MFHRNVENVAGRVVHISVRALKVAIRKAFEEFFLILYKVGAVGEFEGEEIPTLGVLLLPLLRNLHLLKVNPEGRVGVVPTVACLQFKEDGIVNTNKIKRRISGLLIEGRFEVLIEEWKGCDFTSLSHLIVSSVCASGYSRHLYTIRKE